MQGIKALVAELAVTAETPVYSMVRWVEKEAGHPLDMQVVLQVVEDLMSDDRIRLWEVDATSGDRTELFVVPPDLVERYAAEGHTDPSFDPFGLSLTAVDTPSGSPRLDWDIDVDLAHNTFAMRVSVPSEDEVLARLDSIFPRLEFDITSRRELATEVRLSGSARLREA